MPGQLFSYTYTNQNENIEEISVYINILQLIEITLSVKLLLRCNWDKHKLNVQ